MALDCTIDQFKQDKAELLKKIYDGDKQAQIPNEVLYALLSDRAIQELDEGQGTRCFGFKWYGRYW